MHTTRFLVLRFLPMLHVKLKGLLGGFDDIKKFICQPRRVDFHAMLEKAFLNFSYNGPILPPIGKIACAVSVALFRSHLIAPGILACFIGELTWTKELWHRQNTFQPRIVYKCMHKMGMFI